MVPALVCEPMTAALMASSGVRCALLLLSRPRSGAARSMLYLRSTKLRWLDAAVEETSPSVLDSGNYMSLYLSNHAFLLLVALLSVLAFMHWRREVEGDDA